MSGKRQIVAVIPARFASQRLPGKPLAELHGKPMIQHVYERTARASLIDRVVVATDDKRIAAAVKDFGGEAVMTPQSIETGSDRVAHVARDLPDCDIVVNVQGDEPLIESSMIDEAVRPLVEDETIRVGTLARRIERVEELFTPTVVKVVSDLKGNALYFSRSMIPFGRDVRANDLAALCPLFKHIGLYAYRRDFLLKFTGLAQTPLELTEKLEQLRILEHGYSIHVGITEHESYPVDTQADLERVRAMIA
jgi:3-deoxy-manno-octulosonate cytidylyltransferase (CMP-KDO synthetase)